MDHVPLSNHRDISDEDEQSCQVELEIDEAAICGLRLSESEVLIYLNESQTFVFTVEAAAALHRALGQAMAG